MKLTNIDRAFDVWRERGQLDEAQIQELRRTLDESQSTLRSGRAVVLLSTLGAVLVGLVAILFVASHWDTMGPLARSFVLVATYVLSVAAAYATQEKGLPLLSESLWFLSTLVLGADIFLIGQLFNFTLTFWQGPFLWLVGALAMGLARGKAACGWLALPMGLLALGWFGGGSGWFTDDQFEFLASSRGLLPLLPAMGVALLCLAALARGTARFAFVRSACAAWGVAMIAIPLIAGTADDDLVKAIFYTELTSKQIAILVLCGLTIVLFAVSTERPGRFVAVSLLDRPELRGGEACIIGRVRGWGSLGAMGAMGARDAAKQQPQSVDFPQIAQLVGLEPSD